MNRRHKFRGKSQSHSKRFKNNHIPATKLSSVIFLIRMKYFISPLEEISIDAKETACSIIITRHLGKNGQELQKINRRLESKTRRLRYRKHRLNLNMYLPWEVIRQENSVHWLIQIRQKQIMKQNKQYKEMIRIQNGPLPSS